MHVVRTPVMLLRLSTVSAGSRLELNAEFEGVSHQLVTLLADEVDESIWLEVESCGILFQIPLSSVQAAIEAVAEDVHSERWHELNVAGYCEE